MKHASPAVLDAIAPLLAEVRGVPGLVERSRGVFYRKGRAFLHFHEDPKGIFADVRDSDGRDFERIEVSGDAGRQRLLAAARARAG
ncbi:MAG: hypothetical protein KKE02_03950 [Alphaproteobacteria bacterium]|nr:hypothetical protein [Alphaproteobacteria bacterium]MBU1513577.1 hypothetical protein [Alphaproteobacteria bacterium]MBU2094778.1 hypothetical protein [Alphaproteobacteria bacterium]MBU2150153.1 hypothetical protein [Alphaproteobacteria bacterium]MBU2309318.1 hypothetical protein [Alphaproteobacteria bacterium]